MTTLHTSISELPATNTRRLRKAMAVSLAQNARMTNEPLIWYMWVSLLSPFAIPLGYICPSVGYAIVFFNLANAPIVIGMGIFCTWQNIRKRRISVDHTKLELLRAGTCTTEVNKIRTPGIFNKIAELVMFCLLGFALSVAAATYLLLALLWIYGALVF